MSLIEHYVSADARLAAITPDAVRGALEPAGLVPSRGWEWLAKAVQNALAVAQLTPSEDSPDRLENKRIRDEMFAVASSLTDAARLLDRRSQDFDSAVWDAACLDAPSPTGPFDEPPEHRRFTEAVQQVHWLAVFVSRAGMGLDVQKPNWRVKARRDQRVYRAQCLSALYVLAFDAEPTRNRWEMAQSEGLWAAFHDAIVELVYREGVSNRDRVLQDARRLDKLHRVEFGPGIIPE